MLQETLPKLRAPRERGSPSSSLLQKTTLFSSSSNQLTSTLLLYKMTALLDVTSCLSETAYFPRPFPLRETPWSPSCFTLLRPLSSPADHCPSFFFPLLDRTLCLDGVSYPWLPRSHAGQNMAHWVCVCACVCMHLHSCKATGLAREDRSGAGNDRQSPEKGEGLGDGGAFPLRDQLHPQTGQRREGRGS